jgi:hypothetical protein
LNSPSKTKELAQVLTLRGKVIKISHGVQRGVQSTPNFKASRFQSFANPMNS